MRLALLKDVALVLLVILVPFAILSALLHVTHDQRRIAGIAVTWVVVLGMGWLWFDQIASDPVQGDRPWFERMTFRKPIFILSLWLVPFAIVELCALLLEWIALPISRMTIMRCVFAVAGFAVFLFPPITSRRRAKAGLTDAGRFSPSTLYPGLVRMEAQCASHSIPWWFPYVCVPLSLLVMSFVWPNFFFFPYFFGVNWMFVDWQRLRTREPGTPRD